MAHRGAVRAPRRRSAWVWTVVSAIVAVVAVGALLAQGFVRQQVRTTQPQVWVADAQGPYYGAVNSDISEIGSVGKGNSATFSVSGVVQDGSDVLVYSDQHRLVRVNPAAPQSVNAGDKIGTLPGGADRVLSNGGYAAFLNTGSGLLQGGTVRDAASGRLQTVVAGSGGTSAGKKADGFAAAALTERGDVWGVTSAGVLVTYSLTERKRTAHTKTGLRLAGGGTDQLTVFGDHWAVLETPATGAPTLYLDGRRSSVAVDRSARLAQASTQAGTLAIATAQGLRRLDAAGASQGAPTKATGAPAQPVYLGSCLYAAWGDGAQTTVSTCGRVQSLAGSPQRGQDAKLAFMVNGGTVALNETANGVVWLQTGKHRWKLVRSSLDWTATDDQQVAASTQQDQEASTNQCPVPATGAAAQFGVRPGQLASLPVLIGATDPNRGDVVTLVDDPAPSWSGTSLGDLAVSDNGQGLSLQVTAPSGTAEIHYRITDGSDCRVDGVAQVTVRAPDALGEAPVWRQAGADPTAGLQVAPGSTVSFDALSGWVDPDSDPIFPKSVTVAGPGRAVVTAEGRVVYQADPGQAAGAVTVQVTVADSHLLAGPPRSVQIAVTPDPALAAESFARTVSAGTTATVDLRPHVSGLGSDGGVGMRLGDVQVRPGDAGAVQARADPIQMTVSITAGQPGTYPLTWQVSSGSQTATAKLWVQVLDPAKGSLSTSPITVYLSPDQDATVDPLSVVGNPGGGVLQIGDTTATELADPQNALVAQTVRGGELRVSGRTRDDGEGLIGSFRYPVSDGAHSTVGQATVFEQAAATSFQPIAAADRATVRAGESVDIPVLDNDVAPAGATLSLDPRYYTDNQYGLGFPSQRVYRYVAPDEPGQYTMTYRVYSLGHPEQGAFGSISITVVAADGTDHDPQPQDIDARVPAQGSVDVTVPTAGVDPDGDSVSVQSIGAPSGHGQAQLLADGTVRVTSSDGQGPILFDYTVSDGHGGTGTARIRVAVLAGQSSAPVAFTDYLEAGPGQPVSIDPTLNDAAPDGGALHVDAVSPAGPRQSAEDASPAPGGPSAPQRRGKTNVFTFTADRAGRSVYSYLVSTPAGGVAQGTIVLNVSAVALPQYPTVLDSTVQARDLTGDAYTVNVISDRTIWSGSERLQLSLHGRPAGTRVSGDQSISGSLTGQAQTVPFAVTVDTADDPTTKRPVVSFALLHVPAAQQVLPELRNPNAVYRVDEDASVSVDLATAVVPMTGRTLEVTDAAAAGSRSAATCRVQGTTVVYAAGAGAPDSDGCLVQARWKGQSAAAQLLLHIQVQLKHAPPVLSSARIAAVAPAETQTVDLRSFVSWSAGDTAKLSLSCSAQDENASVSCSGTQATVTVRPDAEQGAVLAFPVKVTSPAFSPQPAATMSVQVATLPAIGLDAATLTADASQSGGASVQVSMDALGPNARASRYQPVSLVGGSVAFADPGVSGQLDGSRITVSISQSATGGVKAGTYGIVDAQGNHGTGRIEVTYRALPGTPSGVALQSVDAGSVTLQITPPATDSSPAVTGYDVRWDGGSTHCDLSGTCNIGGLKQNVEHTFSVVAVNSVGSSKGSVSVTGWAWQKPAAVSAGAIQTAPAGDNTASVRISQQLDGNTTAYLIKESGAQVQPGQVAQVPASNGGGTITIQPVQAKPYPSGLVQLPDNIVGATTIQAHGFTTPDFSVSDMQASDHDSTVTVNPQTGNLNGSDQVKDDDYKVSGCRANGLTVTLDDGPSTTCTVTLTGKATGIDGQELTSQPSSQQVTVTRSISAKPGSGDGTYTIGVNGDKTGWTESFTASRTPAGMTLKQAAPGENAFAYCWQSDQSSCGPQGSLAGPAGLPTVTLPSSAQGRTQFNFGGPDQFSPDQIKLDQVPSGVTCTASGSGRQQWVDCQATSPKDATASVLVKVYAGNGFGDLPPLTVQLSVSVPQPAPDPSSPPPSGSPDQKTGTGGAG
ncbi:MAG: Ig-like domain-containing protein [Pseudoclavibacter sp.]